MSNQNLWYIEDALGIEDVQDIGDAHRRLQHVSDISDTPSTCTCVSHAVHTPYASTATQTGGRDMAAVLFGEEMPVRGGGGREGRGVPLPFAPIPTRSPLRVDIWGPEERRSATEACKGGYRGESE